MGHVKDVVQQINMVENIMLESIMKVSFKGNSYLYGFKNPLTDNYYDKRNWYSPWKKAIMKQNHCRQSHYCLWTITLEHMSCKVCFRGCLPGLVPERGPTPFFPKQRGLHQSVAEGGGDGGAFRQAAISRRLNHLWPCSSAEPALSHALQLGAGPRRQWSEGQGSRRRGCLKSFGMLMLCRVFTL